MTQGEWLFYGGVAGMIFFFAAAVVVLSIMARQRKRLSKKLDEEYGKINREQ